MLVALSGLVVWRVDLGEAGRVLASAAWPLLAAALLANAASATLKAMTWQGLITGLGGVGPRGCRRLDLVGPFFVGATVEEEDRQAEGEQRRRVAKALGKSKLPGAAGGALRSARYERRHGGEVIRVGRVAQPEEDGDGDDDPDRGAARGGGDALVEAEHRIHPAEGAALNPRRAR